MSTRENRLLSSYEEEPVPRIAITLTDEQAARLRIAAAEHNVAVSVLGRALLLHGIDELDDDHELRELLTREDAIYRESKAQGGRAAMNARWHGGTSTDEDEPR